MDGYCKHIFVLIQIQQEINHITKAKEFSGQQKTLEIRIFVIYVEWVVMILIKNEMKAFRSQGRNPKSPDARFSFNFL